MPGTGWVQGCCRRCRKGGLWPGCARHPQKRRPEQGQRQQLALRGMAGWVRSQGTLQGGRCKYVHVSSVAASMRLTPLRPDPPRLRQFPTVCRNGIPCQLLLVGAELHRHRMQIELGFRDLKSHRYGQAFEDSLTRKRERIEVLLLLHALAMFVLWLAGMAAESIHAHDRLNPHRSTRRLYCLIRLGWEALTRRWLDKPRVAMLDALHTLSPEAKQNMASRI
ncbi:transposase [Stenotrophomonas sp. NPDC077659]|uniref:transposase n=1 Tax=Stenotrophomonas sp. NPDC077659 TaxID=3390694 RepID=UPI003D008741